MTEPQPKPITPELLIDRLYGDSEAIHHLASQVLADLREYFAVIPKQVEEIVVRNEVAAVGRVSGPVGWQSVAVIAGETITVGGIHGAGTFPVRPE